MDSQFEYYDKTYNLEDFCFKPITGKGCIVTSVMQYWKDDTAAMEATPEPWVTAQCIPDSKTVGRACFDRIGTPTMPFAIFGKYECKTTNPDDPCASCKTRASGFLINFLLDNNAYSYMTAREWEKRSFIRNIKTFNDYFDYTVKSLDQYPDLTYNDDLTKKLVALDKHVKELYKIDTYVPLKVDYLA
jgi:Niemann-Pick C1 protein